MVFEVKTNFSCFYMCHLTTGLTHKTVNFSGDVRVISSYINGELYQACGHVLLSAWPKGGHRRVKD